MILIIVKGLGTLSRVRWTGLSCLLLLVLTACSASTPDGAGRPSVIATTTILGDVAANIGGDGATVEVLIPLGADPHDYRPSAQQVARIQSADLVVVNGLGLEEGLADVLRAAREEGVTILEVGPRLNPEPLATSDSGLDPHVWMDLDRMATAARLIGEALAEVDPSGDWRDRAEWYAGLLASTDVEIREILEVVPPEKRILVTNHDSMGYFARRYGFEVIGTVIPGGSTLADPSSAELAGLVEAVRRTGAPAIFAETTEPALLAEAVAAEVGGDVQVVELFTGSLGPPGSGAETLVALHLTNARRIAEALAC